MLAAFILPAILQAPLPAEAPKPVPSPDREIAFPGFNAHPLKGTVRAAQGSGYFAVMVAGSGLTDRDWSNPLIRDPQTGKLLPSHGGRDFAAWLAKQGIGSLRWDKRFIGSRDPKLDISLDAQAGDIRAALAFARRLPEAKGKKLLLVGHSEGSLLSLLVARDADALLLLALPPQSMARTILEQLKLQLPPDKAAANLAYLESVFGAIRSQKSTPEGSPEIFPGLVALAKSLMRPESLGFVRDTLDLDPLALVAHVSVPCAVLWGDRDVQTWKPATLPAALPATVIEIPEANHLFKRETRPRAGLSGANAGSAYGDDTPMADLSPLAAWLKGLK
jgi:pimeloyl-ACP methyl ester carboxylesterase